MLGGSFFTWWYGLGWSRLMHLVWMRVTGVLGFFSVGLLLGSLFAPYRQISATQMSGSIKVKLADWFDKQFSRLIGAVVRLILVVIGLTSALLIGIIGLIVIIVWPFLPLAPIIGLFASQARFGQ